MIFSTLLTVLAATSTVVGLPTTLTGLDDAMIEKVKANMIEISTHRCELRMFLPLCYD